MHTFERFVVVFTFFINPSSPNNLIGSSPTWLHPRARLQQLMLFVSLDISFTMKSIRCILIIFYLSVTGSKRWAKVHSISALTRIGHDSRRTYFSIALKFKTHLWSDIRKVILPTLVDKVRYIPIPRIEHTRYAQSRC